MQLVRYGDTRTAFSVFAPFAPPFHLEKVLVKTTAQVAKEVNEQSEKFRQERKAELPQSDREKTDLEIEKDAVKHFMNDEGVVTEYVFTSII